MSAHDEITITLDRYEYGLVIVALNSVIDEAEDRQNVALLQLLLELNKKLQRQLGQQA